MDLTPQFLVEKLIGALEAIAKLTVAAESESQRTDALEDGLERLESKFDGKLRELRDELAADEREEQQEAREARKGRVDLVGGLLHGAFGAIIGAIASWAITHFTGAAVPASHH